MPPKDQKTGHIPGLRPARGPSANYQAPPNVASPTPLRLRGNTTEISLPNPNISMPRTAFQVLNKAILPNCPPMYQSSAAKSTRNPFQSTAVREEETENINESGPKKSGKVFSRIKIFVYQSSLVEQLIPEARALLEPMLLDPSISEHNLWHAKVHPRWTAQDLPPQINSEKDSEKYVMGVQVQPVIRCLQAVHAQRTIKRDYGPGGFSNASGSGSAYPIPDSVISFGNHPLATVEVKTHNALRASVSIEDEPFGTFGDLTAVDGLTMRFNYPRTGAPMPKITSQTKILVQLWEQMDDLGVDFAVLSSYEQISFFYRDMKKNALYMSAPYFVNDSPLLHLFAFCACAGGLIKRKSLRLAEVDGTWWPREVMENKKNNVGIHPFSKPEMYLEIKEAALRAQRQRRSRRVAVRQHD